MSVHAVGAHQEKDRMMWIYLLFFISGVPAMIYQIVWQRALFALYGINIESVTIVVSAFMLGLGLGSLEGGTLSRSRRFPQVSIFAVAELGIAGFGLGSLTIFHHVAVYTAHQPLWITGSISFLLVVIPTTLMGCTLPLLIEHLVKRLQNVGASVGALYFVNTLGSGAACIVVIRPLLSHFGQAGAVRCAAVLNAVVGVSALIYSFLCKSSSQAEISPVAECALATEGRLLSFKVALLCSVFCGFAALSYEIIWYRLLAFAAGDTAPLFAALLGSYLVGLALGSRLAERYAERHSALSAMPALAFTVVSSAVVSFWINPILAWALKSVEPGSTFAGLFATAVLLFLVCHAAILFGALFPLIAHVAIGKKEPGVAASYVYAANIVGSTLGVLVVGFILMDRFSLYQIAWVLLLGGVFCAILVFRAGPELSGGWTYAFVSVCIAAVLIAPVSHDVLTTIYDRLLFKEAFPGQFFSEVIENRSGTIGVTPQGTVFGGGVYDGRFNTDLLHDINMIIRPYALSAFHPRPARVLLIGLGSGSWAQVLANHPDLQQLLVVDINPGYMKAVEHHAATASLLQNPKVILIIDDGRRWLRRHPEASFDAVVMNTSYYWRNHTSNLLSVEFLRMVRSHLRSHGVFYYNTTKSDDVIATGLAVYPYALRVLSCVGLSDSPLVFDRVRWKSVLLRYVIDGKRVVDSSDAGQMKKLENIVNIWDAPPGEDWLSVETNEELHERLCNRKNLIFTDDNMGVEWQ
jgi:predicted membrane-bound spermidine synthase